MFSGKIKLLNAFFLLAGFGLNCTLKPSDLLVILISIYGHRMKLDNIQLKMNTAICREQDCYRESLVRRNREHITSRMAEVVLRILTILVT